MRLPIRQRIKSITYEGYYSSSTSTGNRYKMDLDCIECEFHMSPFIVSVVGFLLFGHVYLRSTQKLALLLSTGSRRRVKFGRA